MDVTSRWQAKSVCWCVSVSVYQCVNLSICQCISVSVCQYVCVSVYQCVNLSVCQCVSVLICQCVSASVHQCVSVSVCQCVCASMFQCLSKLIRISQLAPRAMAGLARQRLSALLMESLTKVTASCSLLFVSRVSLPSEVMWISSTFVNLNL